jgi:sulfate permease, SulP family
LVPTALACVLLAYGETISVARSFAQKHGYDISPEQELTALGAANVATGFWLKDFLSQAGCRRPPSI